MRRHSRKSEPYMANTPKKTMANATGAANLDKKLPNASHPPVGIDNRAGASMASMKKIVRPKWPTRAANHDSAVAKPL